MNKGTLIVNGIDYSNGGGSASGDNYSTEEQRIGSWIDGKPLYRKIVYINQTISHDTNINHNIANISKITKLYGVAKSGSNIIPLPYSHYNTVYNMALLCNETAILFRPGTSQSINETYIYIEYTKTTDAAVSLTSEQALVMSLGEDLIKESLYLNETSEM